MMNIKNASELTGVSSDTIRYYEKIGLIPRIDRTSSGIRNIDKRIIGRINFVKQMRSAGMSIENLLKYMNLVDSAEGSIAAQKSLLKEQLEAMVERRDDMQAAIDHLKWKLEHYEEHMAKSEADLKKLEKEHKSQ
ncbi:merr family transcriptional regulator [Liquorilactobacillus uvarum DSM 19971]|uniref:Merr family transcriptional regulator n=2 Tax=Liquorilactobacillus uvarum TaxID=303240 RepID=A0A0R1PJJ6_9LACO|nr:merr family transcriptional regulator [Liquorilactobacillus uvarum DSM 19971]